MYLILSASYIDQEMRSEFGNLPPSFLPLGNSRLFIKQIDSLPCILDEKVYISLPRSFVLNIHDKKLLDEKNVKICYIPDGLSLGASFIYFLKSIDYPLTETINVLFGDTIIDPVPTGNDLMAVSSIKDDYNWSVIQQNNITWLDASEILTEQKQVITGYFSFSKADVIIQSITNHQIDFTQGLNAYHKKVGLNQVKVDNWLDFGHVNTYYRSKASYTTQRAFNNLKITSNTVSKSSSNDIKMKAEISWYESLPHPMRVYTPQFLGKEHVDGRVGYQLEYLYLSSLSELFVFSQIPLITWKKILSKCFEFIVGCRQYPSSDEKTANNLEQLLIYKTEQRLIDFCQVKSINMHQAYNFNDTLQVSLFDIIQLSNKNLPQSEVVDTLIHGDFCLSNVFYEFRANIIKTIDPRGLDVSNQITNFGDYRYDVAKLSHSVIGLYDWIIAGYFEVSIKDNNITFELKDSDYLNGIQGFFFQEVNKLFNLNKSNIYAMQTHLFLSMLPLHADNTLRQDALMANAFRLYLLMKECQK